MTVKGFLAELIRKLWLSIAIVLVTTALILSAVRVGLPYASHFKDDIAHWFTEQFNQPVNIQQLAADWRGAGPVISLQGFEFIVAEQTNSPVMVSIEQVDLELDFWQSFLQRAPVVRNFVLDGVEVLIDVAQLQAAEQSGAEIKVLELFRDIFLNQFQRFDVQNSYITIVTTDGAAHQIRVHQLKWFNRQSDHQGVGEFSLEGIEEDTLAFILDLQDQGDDKYNGQFYVKSDGIDLAPWLRPYVTDKARNLQSKLKFEAWLDIEKSEFQSFLFNLDPSELTWYTGNTLRKLELVSGRLQADLAQSIPHFYMDDLSLAHENNLWGNFDIHAQKFAGNWQIYTPRINLAPVKSIVSLMQLPAKVAHFVRAVEGEPAVENFHLEYASADKWALRGQLAELSWQAFAELPSAQNVQAEILSAPGIIHMQWQAPEQTLHWPTAYGQAIEVFSFSMQNTLYWQTDRQRNLTDWQLKTPKLNLSFADQNIDAAFALYPNLADDTQLSLVLNLTGMPVKRVKQLLPEKLLGEQTYRYLMSALNSGQLESGKAIFQGALQDYPFLRQQGLAHVNLEIKDADFKFQPDWPKVDDVDLTLQILNQGLHIHSSTGKLLDAELVELAASIPDLLDPDLTLSLDIKAKGQAPAVTQIMQQSSLANSVGKALEQLIVQGPLSSQIKVDIPLMRSKDLSASGEVLFDGNSVVVAATGFEFEHVNGLLEFDMDRLKARKMTFDWGPVPYQIDLHGQQKAQEYQVDLDIRGRWPIDAILTQSGFLQLADRIKGSAEVDGHLAIKLPEKGFSYRLDVASDLHGVSLQLPKPLDKKAEHLRITNLTMIGDEESSNIKLDSGDELSFNGYLPHEMGQLTRAYLVLGEEVLSPPATGFNISVHLPQADFAEYLKVISDVQKDVATRPATGQSVIELPKRIRGLISEMSVGPLRWHNVNFDINRNQQKWLANILADEFVGDIKFTDDLMKQGMQIDAQRFMIKPYLATSSVQKNSYSSAEMREIFDNIPAIKFSCQNCQYESKNLGQVDLEIVKTSPQDLLLKNFNMRYREHKVDATGLWRLDAKNNSTTRLKGKVISSDFGLWLRDYQLSSAIRDSSVDADFAFNWATSPLELANDHLNGTVRWQLGEGYLTEVSDKGARILSLLSLDSLVRKLKLDFRDVFSKGLFYNQMKGDIKLNKGIAYTDNTVMDGVAGNMEVKGQTNLVTQTLDYRIKFSPKVTSSLPILIAWMVNPVTGIAALAIDQVIESADVISQIEFQISGTIDEPKVVETGRQSKEVKLNKAEQTRMKRNRSTQ
ncbi:YhdP family protein [Catenovulum sediminis]|uniref:YhdP family protein n=1 Tax=Catenovulum sediminis TaxID=1740262 RepID=A0ABV1RD88_9ALTE